MKTLMGYTAEGHRVTAEIQLQRESAKERETTTHEIITDEVLNLSIVFDVEEKLRNNQWRYFQGGQVPEEDRVLVNESARAALINQLWKDWHLNTMVAGCDHMEHAVPADAVLPESKYGRQSAEQTWRLDNLVCPVTGYRYGRKWLTKPLPEDIITAVQTLGVTITKGLN